MSIDDVIARSRQPGTFSERRRFSVARSRAIQKMRQFALADPAYYVLEWIQSAIANGATYIDLSVGPTEARMSYVGGGFTRAELSALFDFLFASKDDLDVADVRQLALGVNALMRAKPRSIVIESGDGTLQGTTRIEIEGRGDNVYVGTPAAPLDGTFVVADGLRRQFGQLRELSAIEERCLTAPVPILVNGEALFGYTSTRTPDLFGYRRRLKFDEGDLYGTIGLATTGILRTVKLLTWGVWVGSTRSPWEDLPPIGGVVGYDRLRKTADHASIVHDEIVQQMWARIEPYARQLASGETGRAAFDIRRLDGSAVDPVTFRTEAVAAGGAVLFQAPTYTTVRGLEGRSLAIAGGYGEVFDAPVFLVASKDQATVRHLLGPDVEVWAPPLNDTDLAFFQRSPAGPPPRPWLTSAEDLGEVGIDDLPGGPLGHMAVGCRTMAVRVFTPRRYQPGVAMTVELRHAQRSLTSVELPSPYPGHILVVDLDGPIVRNKVVEEAHTIAVAVAEWAEPYLRRVVARVLEAIRPDDVSADDASRVIALAALSRATVLRFRSAPSGGHSARFALFDDSLPESLLDLPVLLTTGGSLHSLRDLETTIGKTLGLIPITNDPLNETLELLERDRIYVADRVTATLLEALMGEAAVVRVHDRRPVGRAEDVSLFDVSVGVAPCHEGALVTEGIGIPDEAVIAELVRQLVHLFESPTTSTQVHRAVRRQLIWNATHVWQRAEQGDISAVGSPTMSMKLFQTAEGGLASIEELGDALRSSEGLKMLDGWAVDASPSHDAAPEETGRKETGGDDTLACDPYVFQVLARVGRVVPALDVDLSVAEARANALTPSVAFLESRQIDTDSLHGRVGFPMVDVGPSGVLLMDRDRRRVGLFREIAREVGGVVGHLHYRGDALSRDVVESACLDASLDMLVSLIGRVPQLAPRSSEYVRAVQILLSFAEQHVRIASKADGSYSYSTLHPVAARILELPLFPARGGVSATGARFLREFTVFGDRAPHGGRTELADGVLPTLSDWLDRVLTIETAVERPTIESEGWTSFADWLTGTLASLQPAGDTREVSIKILGRDEIQRMTPTGSDASASGMVLSDGVLLIAEDFWLLARALDAERRPRPDEVAWLLLAVYALVNEDRRGVTNFHEIQFQARVLDWLAAEEG